VTAPRMQPEAPVASCQWPVSSPQSPGWRSISRQHRSIGFQPVSRHSPPVTRNLAHAMRTVLPQTTLFCGFALGMAGLMAEVTHGSAYRVCNSLCCGMVPALTATLLVPLLTGCCRALRGHSRSDNQFQTPLGGCFGFSVVAAVAISVKVSPLICGHLCGECARLNAGSIGVCAFFFSLLGAAAGATMVMAGEMAGERSRQATRPTANDVARSTPPGTAPLRPQSSPRHLATGGAP